MKNAILLAIFCIIILFANSCKKCYTCYNVCQTCTEQHQDTALTVNVCSDVFGEKYYNEYLDSLQNVLGYNCSAANSTFSEEICGGQTKTETAVINRKDAGLICIPK